MTNNTSIKHLELKKHINAIHCTNNLTLVQRKLVNALLFHAYPDLPNKTIYKISAKKLCDLIGYNSHDYSKLKTALKSLMTTLIEWNVIDYSTSTADKWRSSTILAAATLEAGICTYEYSVILKELLYRPEMYGRINMQIQSEFTSSYALALYENCIRYRGLPQTPWFTLEIFRKLMGLVENKYPTFKDLRKRVLDIAISEVNKHSDVAIKPELTKINKKVVSIRFKLAEKYKENKSEISLENIDTDLADTLVNEFGISPEVTKDILKNYEPSYIKEKIQLTLASISFKLGKITGLAGYLIKALRDDYQPSKSSMQLLERKNREKSAVAKLEEKERRITKEKKKGHEHYIQEKINLYITSLDQENYNDLINAFEQYLSYQPGAEIYLKTYKKSGLNKSGMIKAVFKQYLLAQKAEIFKNIVSFDDYVNEPVEEA